MRARLIMLLLAATGVASAQSPEPGFDRLIVGANAGVFRVNHNDFDKVYGGRSNTMFGGTAVVKIYAPYNLVVKYHRFEKDGSFTGGSVTTSPSWRQSWIIVGVRYLRYGLSKFNNYFGFGLAFSRINESGPQTLFLESSGEHNANGFFLDAGLEYRFVKRTSIFLEFEITSAGVDGKSGFEGTSVGGYFLSMGLNVFVF